MTEVADIHDLNMYRAVHAFWIGATALAVTCVLNATMLRLLRPFHLPDVAADACGLIMTIAVIASLASHVIDRTKFGRFTPRIVARIIYPFD
jgi:uncharacterized membrane protein